MLLQEPPAFTFTHIYTVVNKKVSRNVCPYLCQILTDFNIFFTVHYADNLQ